MTSQKYLTDCHKAISIVGVPARLSLYVKNNQSIVCPGTLDAIQGALGTVCEAVDTVMNPTDPAPRAFVAIRPPGHHCGEDTPSGFCFVNNVAVGAAHGDSYIQSGSTVVLILFQ